MRCSKGTQEQYTGGVRDGGGGGGGRGALCPPPPPPIFFANVNNQAEFGQNSGIFRAFLLVKIMLSGILGACMYPYADTEVSGLARIRA